MTDTPTSPNAWVLSAVGEAIRTAVAQANAAGEVDAPPRVCVALSGGRDSIVLLDALAVLAPRLGVSLSALHVHHGLSPNADLWAAFCGDACAKRGLLFAVVRVRVERRRGESLEAAARDARYAALESAQAEFVVLGHHADDQAETLLLQLFRGAGPHGLAAMPAQRVTRGPTLLRPLLAVPRATIDAYAAERALCWVDDESNAALGYRRNVIRHDIAPRLAALFPGYPATLARAALHQAESARLADELAALDAKEALPDDPGPRPGNRSRSGANGGPTLDRAALTTLAARAPHRARNLLRWFLREHGLVAPSAARLAAMLDQLARAAPDSRVRFVHAGAEVGLHRGRIVVHSPQVAAFEATWKGETMLHLPHGALEFVRGLGAGLDAAVLDAGNLVVRSRRGGERIQLAHDRPRRALKHVLRESGIPQWQRGALPLVYCKDALAAVAGIGVDAAFQTRPGMPGFSLRWHPNSSKADAR